MRYHRDPMNKWCEQAALWSMAQGSVLSIKKCIAAVETKAVTARATTEQVKGVVINGLRPHLRAAVVNHEVDTLEDVKKWTLVAESIATTSTTTPVDLVEYIAFDTII